MSDKEDSQPAFAMSRFRVLPKSNEYSSEPRAIHQETPISDRGERSYENSKFSGTQQPQVEFDNEKPDQIGLLSFDAYSPVKLWIPWIKRPAAKVAIALITLLVIAGIIVAVVLVTRKHKHNETPTTTLQTMTPTGGSINESTVAFEDTLSASTATIPDTKAPVITSKLLS